MKKLLKNKENILLVLCFMIILLKSLISTYVNSVITLIPSIIIFVWFVIKFLKKQIAIKIYDIMFGLMILIGFISGVINDVPIVANLYQIKSLSIYYLLFMLLRNVEIKKIDMFVKTLNITTIILVILAIIEVIFNKDFLFPLSWSKEIVYLDNFIRAYSLICNPNVFAFYLIFVIFYNYKFTENFLEFKYIPFLSLLFIGIILSISRSALIFLISLVFIYLLVMVLQKNKKRIIYTIKHLLIIFAITILSVLAIYKSKNIYLSYNSKNEISENIETNQEKPITKPETSDKQEEKPITKPETSDKQEEKPGKNNNISTDIIENTTSITQESFLTRVLAMCKMNFLVDSLNNGRLAIIRVGLEALESNIWIGTGFSTFLTAASFLNPNLILNARGFYYADNQYMAILVETGIIGFTFLALTVLLLLREQLKYKKFLEIFTTITIAYFGLFINSLEVQLIAFLYFVFISLDKKVLTKNTKNKERRSK